MTEREEEPDRDRTFALLHQLARDVVDRGNMIRINRVAQPETVREERRAQQHRAISEGNERIEPGGNVERDQETVDPDDLAAHVGAFVVEDPLEDREHGIASCRSLDRLPTWYLPAHFKHKQS